MVRAHLGELIFCSSRGLILFARDIHFSVEAVETQPGSCFTQCSSALAIAENMRIREVGRLSR